MIWFYKKCLPLLCLLADFGRCIKVLSVVSWNKTGALELAETCGGSAAGATTGDNSLPHGSVLLSDAFPEALSTVLKNKISVWYQ